MNSERLSVFGHRLRQRALRVATRGLPPPSRETCLCGFSESWSRGPFSRQGVPWPLAAFTIAETGLIVNVSPGLGGRRVDLAYDDVEEAILRPREWVSTGGSIRVRLKAKRRGDITLGTLDDSYRDIGRVLTEHGVPVRRDNSSNRRLIARRKPRDE